MKTFVTLTCGFAALLLAINVNAYNPINPGDLVVYRDGDGSGTLTTNAAAVFLDEYTTSGTLVQSIPMPTSSGGGQYALTAQGTSASEGLLTLSTDGKLLMLTGYNAAPGTVSPSTATAATVNRVVGEVAVNGSGIDTSTALTDASSTSSIRSAAGTDGNAIWVAGGAGAVRYTTKGATTSTQLITTPTNLRQVEIFNGQLMISDQSGSSVRIATVGTGLPTSSGQTATALTGTSGSTPSGPYAFTMLTLGGGSSPDTMYVANDLGNDIEKWSLVSGTWQLTGSVTTQGVRGITAVVDGGGAVDVFFTQGAGTTGFITNIMELVDLSGYDGTLSGTATIIASASANKTFRGIVWVPEPSAMALVGTGLVGLLALRRRRS